MTDVHVSTVVTQPYRRLRNGWFHLGLADIAHQLPSDSDILTPISLYAGVDPLELDAFVDLDLDAVADGMNTWLLDPAKDGNTIFDHLRQVAIQKVVDTHAPSSSASGLVIGSLHRAGTAMYSGASSICT
ncbi:hypothetical protein [Okibacterium fritillariae]|nr:hypothetical protein [Okibacterium fritillariae]